MSGSYPLPEVVTRSGVGLTPRAFQYATSACVFDNRVLERGPRLVAAEEPLFSTPGWPGMLFACRGLSPPAATGLSEPAYGPTASGRPWNTQLPSGLPGHLVWDQFWPI